MRSRLPVIFIASAIVFGGASIALAWTGPTASPPNNNASAPLNVGSVNQVKNGNIGVNGLAVFGNSILQGGSYLNWGATSGNGGYGIWDNGGTLNFKNSGGSWQSLQAIVQQLVGNGSQWTASGSSIYYNVGSVGINTASPAATLEVNGSALFDAGLQIAPEWSGAGYLDLNSNQLWTSSGGLYLQYSGAANTNVYVGGQSGVPQSLIVPNGIVQSPQFCIGSSCITSWPSSSGGTIAGSGSTNYLPRFTNSTTLGNSTLTSDGNSTTANGNFFASGLLVTSNSGSNWFGLEPEQGESPAHGSIVNSGNARLIQFNLTSPYTAAFAGPITSRGLTTSGSVASQYGGTPEIYVNGDNHTGGGIAISDDGGFYDYNNGPVTFNGSTGLQIAGNNGSGSAGTLILANGSQICLNGSCITSWPASYSNSDTLDTVTGRGNTTSNSITVGDLYTTGWLRPEGNNGIYFQSWGSGFYMSDNYWIRGYNANSGIWMNNGNIGTNGGLTVGYGGAGVSAGGAIIAGPVGISTQSPGEALDVNGVIRSNSDIISSAPGGDGANLRMIGGNYGGFFRNDGANTYFLLTNSGNQYGGWNNLRPFYVNDVTGGVTMANGANVAGGLSTNQITFSNNTSLSSAPPVCTGSKALQYDGTNWLCVSIATPTDSTNGTIVYMNTQGYTGYQSVDSTMTAGRNLLYGADGSVSPAAYNFVNDYCLLSSENDSELSTMASTRACLVVLCSGQFNTQTLPILTQADASSGANNPNGQMALALYCMYSQ